LGLNQEKSATWRLGRVVFERMLDECKWLDYWKDVKYLVKLW
jgi:hypothetical protein